MLEYLEVACKMCACQKKGVVSIDYRVCRVSLPNLRCVVTEIQVVQKGCVIVVSIDRSIMRRMKNGHDLVTYCEAI